MPPYLPDLFSRGAAIRDLPATPSGAIGRAAATGAADKVEYDQLSDPNPRPGSATLVSFGEDEDWKKTQGFRLVLGEPAAGDDDARPSWDPVSRVLTVLLPKGEMTTVPLSSYLLVDDLKLMGQWQWLRQFVELLTVVDPDRAQRSRDRCRSDRACPPTCRRRRALAAHAAAAAHSSMPFSSRSDGPSSPRSTWSTTRRRVRSRSAADEADLRPARSDGARPDHRVAEAGSPTRT